MTNKESREVFYAHINSVPDLKKRKFREALQNADENACERLLNVKIKDTTTVTLLSIFLGFFGIDRFYLGDRLIGFIKLAVMVGAPFIIAVTLIIGSSITAETAMIYILFYELIANIWWFVDIFLCRKRVKELNYRNFMSALS